jgi:hypothetical protein
VLLLHWLWQAGQDAEVWQPRHWHDGTIAAELAALNLPENQAAAAVVSYYPDPGAAFFRACTRRADADLHPSRRS